MEIHKNLEVHLFGGKGDWRKWLSANFHQTDGIWIMFAKKGSGQTTVTYEEARELALIYGWIDGLINRYDERFYLVRFTRRRPRSKWSKINRTIVEGLIDSGKMKPSGLAEVEAAKRDGRWEAAYDSSANLKLPADFAKALKLKKNKRAAAFFATISRANRNAIIYRINDAKREETRKKRIAEFLVMLDRGDLHSTN